jgi:hypothetical protein
VHSFFWTNGNSEHASQLKSSTVFKYVHANSVEKNSNIIRVLKLQYTGNMQSSTVFKYVHANSVEKYSNIIRVPQYTSNMQYYLCYKFLYDIIFDMQEIRSIVLGTRIMQDQVTIWIKYKPFQYKQPCFHISITSSYHVSINFGKLNIGFLAKLWMLTVH